ncbi:hypothetical protein PIB30_082786 [Stylosanthes scabra]|uniref:Uncharacterized protein n=1 Tax=Stylosanthes scabra TaxID=79078 RepID=A0ABU6ZQQ5_9FABA|nr:hypothetical protein [Stylosanthes scabra]
MPPPASFPVSSTRQLSSYPLFMNSVAPYLSEHTEPHAFNTLYGLVNEFDMAQTNHTIPGRLSIDSHFHALATSAHSAARQSFDSSHSFNMRGIGEDGVHRANTAPGIDLNFNASSIQEDEEAARYTCYRDSDRSNSDDNDMDEDEEEDYLVADGVDDDNEASQCAGDASPHVAAASTPKVAEKRYDLRTERSRRNPNRFTPSGWSTKDLKKGASRMVKNVKDRFKKK